MSTPRYLYQEIANLVQARLTSIARQDGGANRTAANWVGNHTDRIEHLVKEHMPSGSGFDNGTRIDLDRSHADKLVFTTAFHHMNAGGFYDGWTEHTVTVTPSLLMGFHLRISGRDRNDIKDYISEEFQYALIIKLDGNGKAFWREAAKIDAEATPRETCGSCGADIGRSIDFPWHGADEDCRALKQPVGSADTSDGSANVAQVADVGPKVDGAESGSEEVSGQ